MTVLRSTDVESHLIQRRNPETSLVPADTIAGRALVVVIAIMTFLVCLTMGGALLISQAAHDWRSEASGEVTIQIKPRSGEDLDVLVKRTTEAAARTPGVTDAHALSQSESQRTLEPWLGQGLDLSQLPIPRLIVVNMKVREPANLQALRETVASVAPRASIDDHQLWITRLDSMADEIVVFAVGILVLIIIAMGLAIGFATRGAMVGNREIIEVLHFVGAADTFIAKQFQSHFTRLGSRGAAIGGLAAALLFVFSGLFSIGTTRLPSVESIGALFGGFALSYIGYFAIGVICLAIATLTGLLSRAIVFRHLYRLY